MSEETARLEETEILDPILEKVHVGMIPEVTSIGRISDLQSRIFRMLPPDSASRVAWVPPERYELTLAYLGTLRVPLMAAVQDVCHSVFAKAPALVLQADRLQTSHDSRGTPRVLAVGFSPDGHELEALRQELVIALQDLGLEVSPKDFLPRVVLGRLSEEVGPVMSVLESFASGFPLTLHFPEVDVLGRSPGAGFERFARILPGRPRPPSLFARTHGCCKSQAGRFSYTLMMDCPMRDSRASELSCFETGESPQRPAEDPQDATPVETGLIHDSTLDLPRIGRRRPLSESSGSFGDKGRTEWSESIEEGATHPKDEDRGPRPPRSDRGPRPSRSDRGPRPPRSDRGPRPPRSDKSPRPPRPGKDDPGSSTTQSPGAGVNHRDPRNPPAGGESGQKQQGEGSRRRRSGRNKSRNRSNQPAKQEDK